MKNVGEVRIRCLVDGCGAVAALVSDMGDGKLFIREARSTPLMVDGTGKAVHTPGKYRPGVWFSFTDIDPSLPRPSFEVACTRHEKPIHLVLSTRHVRNKLLEAQGRT